jgi:antitoxin component of RelBE/YafQ-DinJ toxin-antitoxin module
MGKTTKARLNLTIDPDIYRKSRQVFQAMDMNMSAFMEIQLAKFLQTIQPLMPLLKQVERGEMDAADAKAAIRIWFAHSIGPTVSVNRSRMFIKWLAKIYRSQ